MKYSILFEFIEGVYHFLLLEIVITARHKHQFKHTNLKCVQVQQATYYYVLPCMVHYMKIS